MLCWINGEPADQIAVTDRGLAYGDGLFETIKVLDAKPQRLERHLQRLRQGCERLYLPVDMAQLRAELLAFACAMQQGVMKLMLTRGSGSRGYGMPVPTFSRRILQSAALPNYPTANREQGIELFACQTRLSCQPRLAGLKHLNRLEQVLARNEWSDPRYSEGLMQDMQGHVVEGVFSNLFFARDNTLYTPLLDECGVAGVMRAEILSHAQSLSIDLVQGHFTEAQLLEADEVFFCNSLYGIWPVRALGAKQWSVGPMTRRLQALISTPLD